MLAPRPSRIVFMLATWLACSSCADIEIRDVDPPIVLQEGFLAQPVEGEPEVEVGYGAEGAFEALTPGMALPVLKGIQAGYWSMPTIRTRGIGSPATVECTVVTEPGELVSRVKAKAKFSPIDGGQLEVRSFPIPVRHEGAAPNDPVDDLYGLGCELSCSATDSEGRSDTLSLNLVFEKAE